MSVAIRTEHLTKTYGGQRGIRDVNLTVEEGEIFGFLGPNGAGKSTTIRTLLGFLWPESGRAEVMGFDTQTESVEVRAQLGNLPDEVLLEDRMTGEQLLSFFGRLRGVENLDYAYELAARLDADLERPMRRLSTGNKQKIGIVQAMFHRPPLLILDEPTGGLDPLVQEEFLKLITEVREEGRTVFFSSHNLAEVERVSDRVGIIREGELVTVEKTADVIDRSFRHVRITFEHPLQPDDAQCFAALPGVENFALEGNDVLFTLYGNVDEVIKLTARHTVTDIDFERPSLEEIFLTYYTTSEEGEQQ